MSLKRLIDLPGVRDLETKALMKPRMGDVDARPEFPEIDEVVRANFGLTASSISGKSARASTSPMRGFIRALPSRSRTPGRSIRRLRAMASSPYERGSA